MWPGGWDVQGQGEKETHHKGTNIFVYRTEKNPNDELVMLTF